MIETIIIVSASKLHILIALVGIWYFLLVSLSKKKELIFLGAVSIPLAYMVGKISGLIVKTTRPFVELGADPLVPHIIDNGFPSEHTLYAMVIAGVIFLVHKKLGIFLWILGLFVGIGRVSALVHNPVDILGSAAISFLVIYAAFRLTKLSVIVRNLKLYANLDIINR